MGWLGRLLGRAEDDPLLPLRLRLTRWRHFLWTEHAFLGGLEDLSQKLWGEFVLDRQFAAGGVEQAFQRALGLAYDGGILCADDAEHHYQRLDVLRHTVTDYLAAWPLGHEGPPVQALGGGRVIEVGEPARDLGLALGHGTTSAAGFVITCQALLALLVDNGLAHLLRPASASSRADWEAAYSALAAALPRATVPAAITQAIDAALSALPGEPALWLSPTRTEALAALDEPAPLDGSPLLERSLRLWSSFFVSPQVAEVSARTRCAVLAAIVVQPRAERHDVLCLRTLDPGHPRAPTLQLRLEGQPWQTLSRTGPWPDQRQAELVRHSLRVERLTHRAAELLWQRDGSGRLTLLRTRRLDAPRAEIPAPASAASLKGQGHLCRGVASGPAFHVADASDLAEFPEGGVLVAPRWEAELDDALTRAAALILGPPPPYPVIARIRSLGIPAIVGLARAVEIPTGTVVTVDAEEERVYRGRLDELCVAHLLSGGLLEDEPEYQALEGLLTLLGHPEAAGSSGTLLDEVRKIRSRVLAEMARGSGHERLRSLKTPLHLGGRFHVPVVFADLDGVAETGHERGVVEAHAIRSAPWAPFLEGLLTELELPVGAEPAVASPSLLIASRRALHLAGSQCLLSARLTGVKELNHLHWTATDAAEEIRCFGRPDPETSEHLRAVGRRWGARLLGLHGDSR
jgi:phosphohistidine swiveling domain-containing protein